MYEEIRRAAVQDALGVFKLAAGPGMFRSLYQGARQGLGSFMQRSPGQAFRAGRTLQGSGIGAVGGAVGGAVIGGLTAKDGDTWGGIARGGAAGAGLGAAVGGGYGNLTAHRTLRGMAPDARKNVFNNYRTMGTNLLSGQPMRQGITG